MAQIADSNSRKAVSFSCARTMKRFPETQPQLQPALLRLSAMISQDFTAAPETVKTNLHQTNAREMNMAL
jgi:hypothetical protein